MSDRFGDPPQTMGLNDLSSPFVFVRRGDPEPLAWMAAHPGWVKFPATLDPRASIGVGESVAADPPEPLEPVEQKSQVVPPRTDGMSTTGPRQGSTGLADFIRSYNDMSLLIGAPLVTPPTASDPASSWPDAAHALSALFGIPAAQAQTEEEPIRRGEAGPGSLEPAEALRLQRFNSSIETLKRLEPDNREITYLSTPEFIPDEATVERVEAEARAATARRIDQLRVDRALPEGFPNQAALQRFVGRLKDALAAGRVRDSEIGLIGSSVTGFQYRSGQPFGPDSDLDVYLVSPTLLARARQSKMKLRGGGGRTSGLKTEDDLAALGLPTSLIEDLRRLSGNREVSIMIYGSSEALSRRNAPYMLLTSRPE